MYDRILGGLEERMKAKLEEGKRCVRGGRFVVVLHDAFSLKKGSRSVLLAVLLVRVISFGSWHTVRNLQAWFVRD